MLIHYTLFSLLQRPIPQLAEMERQLREAMAEKERLLKARVSTFLFARSLRIHIFKAQAFFFCNFRYGGGGLELLSGFCCDSHFLFLLMSIFPGAKSDGKSKIIQWLPEREYSRDTPMRKLLPERRMLLTLVGFLLPSCCVSRTGSEGKSS